MNRWREGGRMEEKERKERRGGEREGVEERRGKKEMGRGR